METEIQSDPRTWRRGHTHTFFEGTWHIQAQWLRTASEQVSTPPSTGRVDPTSAGVFLWKLDITFPDSFTFRLLRMNGAEPRFSGAPPPTLFLAGQQGCEHGGFSGTAFSCSGSSTLGTAKAALQEQQLPDSASGGPSQLGTYPEPVVPGVAREAFLWWLHSGDQVQTQARAQGYWLPSSLDYALPSCSKYLACFRLPARNSYWKKLVSWRVHSLTTE